MLIKKDQEEMNRQKSTQIDTQKGIFGNTLRNSRIEHHLSQEELAEEIEITPTHLKHLESEHKKPSIEVLFKLARTLHFSLDNIIFSQEDTIQMKIQEIYDLLPACTEKELQIIIKFIYILFNNR